MPKSLRRVVSIVLPIFNEEGTLPTLVERLDAVMARREDLDWELVFVNDGSRDRSLEILGDLAARDPRIVVLDFSRNFGHQIAVTAGLDRARGDAVIVMDADLQDPPEVCLTLIERWEEGYDVAYAQRTSRKDTVFKRATAAAYYRMLSRLADVQIPRNTGDFRLMDRAVVDDLVGMREHHRFLRGMVSYVGYRQVAVPFDRDERYAGETGYPLRKMIRFAVDGVLSFSTAPLRLVLGTGYAMSALSFLGILYALFMRVFFPEITVEGWTLLIIAVLLIGGVQLIMLGIIGQYIGRIYTNSQGRPLYFVRREIVRGAVRRPEGRA